MSDKVTQRDAIVNWAGKRDDVDAKQRLRERKEQEDEEYLLCGKWDPLKHNFIVERHGFFIKIDEERGPPIPGLHNLTGFDVKNIGGPLEFLSKYRFFGCNQFKVLESNSHWDVQVYGTFNYVAYDTIYPREKICCIPIPMFKDIDPKKEFDESVYLQWKQCYLQNTWTPIIKGSQAKPKGTLLFGFVAERTLRELLDLNFTFSEKRSNPKMSFSDMKKFVFAYETELNGVIITHKGNPREVYQLLKNTDDGKGFNQWLNNLDERNGDVIKNLVLHRADYCQYKIITETLYENCRAGESISMVNVSGIGLGWLKQY